MTLRKLSRVCFTVAAVFAITSVRADEPQCKRPELAWENWRDHVIASNPGIRLEELVGEQRDELLKAYSCEGPGPDCPPDQVMVLHCSDNAMVLIAFVRGGCVTMAEDVKIEDFMGFIQGGVPC